MPDERPAGAPDAIATGFQALVEGLRDDFREDLHEVREDIKGFRTELGRVEERVTAQAEGTRAFIETFAVDHGKAHEAEAAERRNKYGEFHEFIRKFELDQARRDGALGVIRWVFELLSKHATRIAWIALSFGAAAGVATGNIDVSVGQ